MKILKQRKESMNPFDNLYCVVCLECGAMMGSEHHFCPQRKDRRVKKEYQRMTMKNNLKKLREKLLPKKRNN